MIKRVFGIILLFPSLAMAGTIGIGSISGGAGVITILSGGVVPGVATNTGAISPGTVADDSSFGTKTWTNPTNAAAQDDTYAGVTIENNGETSHYLKATNFPFPAIPSDATIDGIVVEIEKFENSGSVTVADSRVRIVKGGTIGATDKSSGVNWDTSDTDTYTTYGSSSDKWGETWTAADISSTFGVAIAGVASCGICLGGGGDDAFIDHIRITVYYTTQGVQKSITVTQ